MLPRLEIVARHRPIDIVAAGQGPVAPEGLLPLLAPHGAVEAALPATGAARIAITGPDGTVLAAVWDGRRVALDVAGGRHRSRRHGRPAPGAERLALTLTGRHLAALTRAGGTWTVRARVDLARVLPRLDVRDPGWLAGLRHTVTGGGEVRAGAFGQLGLRDVRLVSEADGSPYSPEGEDCVLFTATSAGPGFFDTAHTSVWALHPDDSITHRGDLFFTRPDRPGVYGDHASHLLRDGDRWLVATSTWADFPAERRARGSARVAVTLAESTADLTRGRHVLAARELALPTVGPSVGVWDPHLVRPHGPDGPDDADGAGRGWLVGYVSARRFFDFHPVVAAGPTLDQLVVRGAATDRRATEGTTLHRDGARWCVLASDGRDNPPDVRGRFSVFDLAMDEIGTLDAPYPTNIPWPTVVPPAPDEPGSADGADGPDAGWRLITFNGSPSGGALVGYGTHGDVVVMRERRN
ncbi:hypothetical protein ACFQ0K_13595 [Nocardioides caeni]|uniref:Uncharacterized protein n=1 Tax=Nocardioides caeni TaxID=574700 RepID=A0A4S8N1H4_9ACTN|nr:hypothetical protein [Nocardioides caeni]THV08909.1 hypothetical protein E9934_18375 [Nocardioides caeni]